MKKLETFFLTTVLTTIVLLIVVVLGNRDYPPKQEAQAALDDGIEEALGADPNLQVVWIIRGQGWELKPYNYGDILPKFNEQMHEHNIKVLMHYEPIELGDPLWSHGSWFLVDSSGVTHLSPRSTQVILGPRAMMVARSIDGKNRQFLLFNNRNCVKMISVLEAPQIK